MLSAPRRLRSSREANRLHRSIVEVVDPHAADQTPSVRRALIGLALFVVAIVGGYLWLRSLAENAGPAESEDGGGVLVRFVRTGGFAGTDDRLVLRTDGSGVVTGEFEGSPQRVQLSGSSLERLLRQLDAVWPASGGPIGAPDGCEDCYQYEVTYAGVSVTIHGIVPERFEGPISTLSRLVDGTGARD